uniref:Uncharacterized protein n=1 Tax=Anguilla anguilla TaxID=7936 RepID=A0A0E9UHQ2_ANGAN
MHTVDWPALCRLFLEGIIFNRYVKYPFLIRTMLFVY